LTKIKVVFLRLLFFELNIAVGTNISPQGGGYAFTPGIYNETQVEGWRAYRIPRCSPAVFPDDLGQYRLIGLVLSYFGYLTERRIVHAR
jgi:hypothetical protein